MDDVFEKIWILNRAGYSVCFEPIKYNNYVRVNVKFTSSVKCIQTSSICYFSSELILSCLNGIIDELKKQDEILKDIIEE